MLRELTSAPEESRSAAPAPRRRGGRPSRLLAIGIIGTGLAVAGCGTTAASRSPAPANPAAPASSAAPANPAPAASASRSPTAARARQPGIHISVRSSQYGRILRDGSDRTIYLFTHDRGTPSTCYGACATAWPPVLTKGRPAAAGAGISTRLLGTTHRRDGTLQVTYGGHPLYYYVNDVKPGQILCQNVDEFGGTWLVVSPHGTAVR